MNIRVEQIEMLGNRILIKPDPAKAHEIVTAGGLVTAAGSQIQSRDGIQHLEDMDIPTGRVVAVGEDCKRLKAGDHVMYSPFSGKKLGFREGDVTKEFVLMSEPEPVLIIKDTKEDVRKA